MQPIALRVAAIRSLGLAAHGDAAAMLNQIASGYELEPQEIHNAIVRAVDTVGRRAAPGQVLDAFVSIFMCAAVAPETRRMAAVRFLKIEEGMHNWARRKCDAARGTADHYEISIARLSADAV
jgi:hypothetical protein